MKVWTLEVGCIFEGGHIIAIYDSELKARQAASLYMNDQCVRYSGYEDGTETTYSQEEYNYWIEHWTCDGSTYSNNYVAVIERLVE